MSLTSAFEFLPGTSIDVQGLARLMCQASDEIPDYLCETPCKLLSLSDQILRRALRDETTRFEWQAGDVLLLDNFRTAHGRDSFAGERTLLAALISRAWEAEAA